MSQSTQSLLLAMLSLASMFFMLAGIWWRETLHEESQSEGTGEEEESTQDSGPAADAWRGRHAVRWVLVCILALEFFHHIRYTWLPDVSIDKDYVLPDLAICVLGVVYGGVLARHSHMIQRWRSRRAG